MNNELISTDDERRVAEIESKVAEEKLQSLCASHAATFVAVETRGAALTSSLKQLLSALNEANPRIEKSKCNLELNDADESNVIALADKHKLRRRTLLHHSSLLELLELPNLMDACVRGHLYEEALSIAGHANTLERRHLKASSTSFGNSNEFKKNPVVANVVNEVRKRESDLRRHLLHRLRLDVTMPQSLEVITALRRLNGVELERASQNNVGGVEDVEKLHQELEWQLKVQFLESRDIWLESNTDISMGKNKKINVAPSGQAERLLDSIDIFRTRCFEIATQFLAIFRSSIHQGPSTLRPTDSTVSSKLDQSLQLLSIWTTRRINIFLTNHLTSHHLSLITDTATLRDALDSASFFASSMGRIGADFTSLLLPIFEPRLIAIVTSHWVDGVQTFEDTLKVCREAGIASPLYSSSGKAPETSSNGDTSDSPLNEKDSVTIDEVNRTSSVPSPPRQLLSLPPLARLVNSFLIGLNELRRCLLPTSFPKLRHYFVDSFVKKVKCVLIQNDTSIHAPGYLSWKGEEAAKLRSVAVEIKDEFEKCAEPYMTIALEVAFGVLDSSTSKNLPETLCETKEQENEVETEDLNIPVQEPVSDGEILIIQEKTENMKVNIESDTLENSQL